MSAAKPKEGYVTSLELLAGSGISYRQLDYWTTRGWLRGEQPSGKGSGHGRLYASGEVEVARRMHALIGAGMRTERAVAIARSGQTEFPGGVRIEVA